MEHTATYSPEDNKLRIYPAHRLAREEYEALKRVGFAWAPKQEVFVAPAWTPEREDAAEALCGEIGDEDSSLVDRAADRAERFEGYAERRLKDAERAQKQVAAITDGIPLGQPILVGHHSEKHARRDAEKIKRGMDRAVTMWRTSKYWESRAAGALRHAKYKERPDVRARRIKGLEADERKMMKHVTEAEKTIRLWRRVGVEPWLKQKESGEPATIEQQALFLAGNTNTAPMGTWSDLRDGKITPEEAKERTIRAAERMIAWAERWLEHIRNRLVYERAMLAEAGGLVSDRFDFQVGGQVLYSGEWCPILRLNKKGGALVSVTCAVRHYFRPPALPLERIKDYRPPAEGAADAVKAATKLPPMCNYPTPDCATMTQAEFSAVYKDHKGSMKIAATDTAGLHRLRTVEAFIGRRHGAKPESQWCRCLVYLSDAPRKDPPPPGGPAPAKLQSVPAEPPPAPAPAPEPPPAATPPTPQPTETKVRRATQAGLFEAMEETLRQGVKIVAAPQLFPTPPDLAARMVELAGIEPGHRVLEPSAGTGNIAHVIATRTQGTLLCVEIKQTLADSLRALGYVVECADFLECNAAEIGTFDRIVMNPPFEKGADIQHIEHARTLLRPGGRIVALCANGPRQRAKLMPLADTWEDLPTGTFASQGTGVNVSLLIVEG